MAFAYDHDCPFEVFITNLGKYNEGNLIGEWVKFPTTEEELKKVFERIGIDGSFYTIKINGEKIKKEVPLKSHEGAVKILTEELINYNIVKDLNRCTKHTVKVCFFVAILYCTISGNISLHLLLKNIALHT